MNGFTPNDNTNVIRLLSEAIRKCNKGRNRILMGAVVLCILTLTFVFGTAYGKINAEYTKNIRMDGTTASTYIEEGTKQQYEKVRSLGYVKETLNLKAIYIAFRYNNENEKLGSNTGYKYYEFPVSKKQ